MKKRGQVTIFIIIGIIILLLTTIFILYRNQVTIFKPEIIIPTEVEPVKNYIEDCIYVTAEEGIRLLGANGGFIRFPDSIDNDPSASITTNPFFKDIKTPLWRYRGQTRIPSEAQMIADLEYYIEENLNTCMLDLEPFQALFSIEKGNTSVKVELIDDGVLVELNYPLKLVLGQKNQTTTINQFTSLVPLRLKHIY